jgi:hypothetical protein
MFTGAGAVLLQNIPGQRPPNQTHWMSHWSLHSMVTPWSAEGSLCGRAMAGRSPSRASVRGSALGTFITRRPDSQKAAWTWLVKTLGWTWSAIEWLQWSARPTGQAPRRCDTDLSRVSMQHWQEPPAGVSTRSSEDLWCGLHDRSS